MVEAMARSVREVEQHLHDRQIWQNGDHDPNENQEGTQPQKKGAPRHALPILSSNPNASASE